MLDNERFGKRLVKAGVITQDQLDEALHHNELQEGRLGEVLVRLGYVSESTILQFLAAEFRTRYVSTERLARARIPQQVLDLLPVHLAERYNLIPVLYDAETSTLSIVTSEPQNEENLREVHMLTSVRELRVYVALQPAVQAAIRKHYRGEINAFKDLLYQNASPLPTAGGYPSGVHPPIENYTENYESASYQQQGMTNDPNQAHGYNPNPYGHNNPYEGNYNQQAGYTETPYQYGNNYGSQQPYDYQADPAYNNYGTEGHTYGDVYQDDYELDSEKTRLHVGPYTLGNYDSEGDADAGNPANAYAGEANASNPPESAVPVGKQADLLGLTKLLVSQVEALHPRYKHHLERQRPLLQAILRRLDFSNKESQPIWLAFHLHHIDLPDPHPTLLSIAENKDKFPNIETMHRAFLQRMNVLNLPDETMEILQNMYERADGSGFPNGLLREEIPLGSRLLCILDAFEDLQHNHPTAPSSEWVQKLREKQGELFDSRLLDFFEEELVRVEKYQNGQIPRILLLEPEKTAAQELERILWDRNFWVYTTSHPDEAEEICRRESIDLMVLEVALPGERDGFVFAEELRAHIENPPELIFLTHRNGSDELDRGIELARDYLLKPLSANIIAAKINKQVQQILKEKAQRKKAANPKQLSGSLEQLGLADLLQFLSQGRRSGRLSIESEGGVGHIFLDVGMVVNATLKAEKGEAALYKMMSWEKGMFTLDPSITTDERLIHKSTDGLLLDLLRILDESRRDGIDDPFGSQSGDDESSFFDLSFDDDEEDASAADANSDGSKSGIFGGIGDGDLDDMFSSSFKEASQGGLVSKTENKNE